MFATTGSTTARTAEFTVQTLGNEWLISFLNEGFATPGLEDTCSPPRMRAPEAICRWMYSPSTRSPAISRRPTRPRTSTRWPRATTTLDDQPVADLRKTEGDNHAHSDEPAFLHNRWNVVVPSLDGMLSPASWCRGLALLVGSLGVGDLPWHRCIKRSMAGGADTQLMAEAEVDPLNYPFAGGTWGTVDPTRRSHRDIES